MMPDVGNHRSFFVMRRMGTDGLVCQPLCVKMSRWVCSSSRVMVEFDVRICIWSNATRLSWICWWLSAFDGCRCGWNSFGCLCSERNDGTSKNFERWRKSKSASFFHSFVASLSLPSIHHINDQQPPLHNPSNEQTLHSESQNRQKRREKNNEIPIGILIDIEGMNWFWCKLCLVT